MSEEQEQAQARMKLARLKLEHDDYHAAIDAMIAQKCDPLQVQRMKKKKLELKDRIKKVTSTLIPIVAFGFRAAVNPANSVNGMLRNPIAVVLAIGIKAVG